MAIFCTLPFVSIDKTIAKMSFFAHMFGGKKEKIQTTGEAIRNLRETEDMLMKKQEYLEQKINQEIEIAKKNGSKNKRGNYD